MCQQKMADLPESRILPDKPPFTFLLHQLVWTIMGLFKVVVGVASLRDTVSSLHAW